MDEDKKKGNIISRGLLQICDNPLFLLILITLGVIAYIISIQMRIGVPYWDVFNYLNNALYFAGIGGGSVSLFLPPLIPILTSFIFRLGYVSVNAVFIVSGFIFLIGVIGFYFLLKERFNPIQSFTGSIFFISLPVISSWIVSGGIDIPGVVFSVWAVYFLVAGLKRDSRLLYLVLPTLIIAMMARYTSGLIIIPLCFYILINLDDFRRIETFKKIVASILIEFGVLIVGVLYFFVKMGAGASILNLIFAVATATSTGAGDVAYNPNNLYYLQNLLNYISIGPLQGTYQQILNPSLGVPSIISYLIAIIIVVGLLIYIYNGVKSRFEEVDLKASKAVLLKSILITVLTVGFIISFYYQSLIISEILLFSTLYTIYRFLFTGKNTPMNSRAGLDFMFLSWFAAFLIFHSILPFKVDRYFITMAPAMIYFMILGLSEFIIFIHSIRPDINISSPKKCGIWIIVALILLFSATATYTGHAPKKTFTLDIASASNWLTDYDPDYQHKNIRSDYPNAMGWYLKMDILGAYPRLYNTTSEFNDYLKSNGVDYFIDSTSQNHPDLESYKIIKSFGVVVIYQRV
ncbi:glycosyltransferase family 39 protein [uncultured Methanobacterium sp.]|uniref:glycosyltransferase family 39 protein n=1 Tax=uncultured Methanobacterium sp. TaxID=176306 RepID=UPI002AA68546|nr:glycosyltransferase family 39 protein [uncultured Methanobacterium sp.]